MIKRLICTTGIVVLAALSLPAQAVTVYIEATQDNTLYESPTGNLSNGGGNHLFVGRTAGMELRRTVLAFKNLTAIPEGATIQSVKLHMYLSKEKSPEVALNLVRLNRNWGEGESQAEDEEGKGADPDVNEATWIHAFRPEIAWTNPGGDFAEVQSATQNVDGVGPYTFGSTDAMVADVEDWLANPDNNFGWIIIGPENATTSKRFDSRDNSQAANRPMLEVTYTMDGDDDPVIFDFSGLWYDPSLDGEGFNIIKSEFGWVIYFYGYTADMQRLWLVSEVVEVEDFQFNQDITFKMMIGTPGTFNEPSPPADLVEWGKLEVLFESCTKGLFVLEGNGQLKISQVVKLLGIEGTQCLNV